MKTAPDLKSFQAVLVAEHARIRSRRRAAGLPEGDPANDSIGLALSGGGVRSATFNLGLLQAMQHYGFFHKVDYLSTVSGGGYIGASLTWFMSKLGLAFPFLTTCTDPLAARVLRWLRRHASYLVPGQGLGLFALAAAVLRGMFINLLIFIPLFTALVYGLASEAWPACPRFSAWPYADAFPLLFASGTALAGLLLASFFVYAVLSVSFRQYDFDRRRQVHVWLGRLLAVAVCLLVLGAMPLVYDWLRGTFQLWWRQAVSSITLGGALSLLAGWLGRSHRDETHGWVAWLLRAGLALLLFGLLLWLYHLARYLHQLAPLPVFGHSLSTDWLLAGAVLVSLFTGWMSNINLVSMHRYYRDRLLEAYMPEFGVSGDATSFSDSDKCYLHTIPQTAAPYHLINAHLVTVGSAVPRYRARGGDNFIFSPEYVGSEATGYVATATYEFGETNLATAFAISGAAVDPNTGVTRSRPLAFIMTLLNVRLGYWMRNPSRPRRFSRTVSQWIARPFWHLYVLREMFGWGMDEKGCYVHLSDGGHFENLGLYELVRRRCRYIIVADAGADPDWTYGDLARACERIRADFCAHLEIDTRPVHPRPDSRLSEQPCTLGRIHYEDGGESQVLFLKTTVFPRLPEDIYGYKRVHPGFPDETTADQFFDETQFEAYRELGYGAGRYIFEGRDLEAIFAARGCAPATDRNTGE